MEKERLKILDKGPAILVLIKSRIQFGMLLGPVLLLLMVRLIVSSTSNGLVGERKKLFSCGSVRYVSKFWLTV